MALVSEKNLDKAPRSTIKGGGGYSILPYCDPPYPQTQSNGGNWHCGLWEDGHPCTDIHKSISIKNSDSTGFKK